MKPLRIGLAGAGAMGTGATMGFVANEGIQLTAVYDIDQARAELIAGQFKAPATRTYAALVDAVDLVYVASTPASHKELVLTAIAAGKHVLCEKPLAIQISDIEEMLQAAEKAGVIHAIGHQTRYVPGQRHMARLVREGYVGETRLVDVHLPADYGTYPTMMPYYNHWTTKREEAGGAVFEFTNHHIDVMRMVFGDFHVAAAIPHMAVPMRPRLDDATPLRDGRPVTPGPLEPAETEDTAVAIGRLATGGVASLSTSWTTYFPPGNRWHIYGSEGTLIYRDTGFGSMGELMGARAGEDQLRVLETPEDLLAPNPPGTNYGGLHRALGRDLLAAFNDRAAPTTFSTFADALRNHQIMEAIVEGRAERT